jgi:hypothetical protein
MPKRDIQLFEIVSRQVLWNEISDGQGQLYFACAGFDSQFPTACQTEKAVNLKIFHYFSGLA